MPNLPTLAILAHSALGKQKKIPGCFRYLACNKFANLRHQLREILQCQQNIRPGNARDIAQIGGCCHLLQIHLHCLEACPSPSSSNQLSRLRNCDQMCGSPRTKTCKGEDPWVNGQADVGRAKAFSSDVSLALSVDPDIPQSLSFGSNSSKPILTTSMRSICSSFPA